MRKGIEKNRIRNRESGQGIVEFALVLPVFLLIVFFIIDCGWILYQNASLDYGLSHASWYVDAGVMADPGDYESGEEEAADWTAGYGALSRAMEESIRQSALIGFRPKSLLVTVRDAFIINEPEIFLSVPGPREEEIRSRLTTRKMHVTAEVRCQLSALTPIGSRIFRNSLQTVRTLDYERVVGKQIRNAGTADRETE